MAQRTPVSHVDTYSSYDTQCHHPRTAGDVLVNVVEGSGPENEFQPRSKMEIKHRKKQVAPIQTTFYCWKFTKAAPSKDKDAPNWKRAERVQMTLPSDELAAQVKKQCKTRSLTEMYEALSTDQRQQVEVLVQKKRREETSRYANWEIAAIYREIFNNLRTRVRETTFIRVILRREDNRRADNLPQPSKALDTASNISDLNELSSLRSKQVGSGGDLIFRSDRTSFETNQKDRRNREDVIEVVSVPDIFQGSSTPTMPPPVPRALLSRQNQAWEDGIREPRIFQEDKKHISIPCYQPSLCRSQQFSPAQQAQQTKHCSHEQDALTYIAEMKQDIYAGIEGQQHDQQRQSSRQPQALSLAVDRRPLAMRPILQMQWRPGPQRHQSYPQHSNLTDDQYQDYDAERQQPYTSIQRGDLDKLEAIVIQQPTEQSRRHQTNWKPPRSSLPEPWSSERPLPAPWNFEHCAHEISTETPPALEPQLIERQTDSFGPRIDNHYEVAEPIFTTKPPYMNADAPRPAINHHSDKLENWRETLYNDEATAQSEWPSYNPVAEEADLPVSHLQPQQQAKRTNQSAERMRREDILFWRTQAQLSHSRSASSLDDQSSTLASPEQSTPPTSISGERRPLNRENRDRPTYDPPEQFGQQLSAHEFLRPSSNRQHEKPSVNRTQNEYRPQTSDLYAPSPNHQNAYQRPLAPEPPAPQTNYVSKHPSQQYRPQHQETDNASMLKRLNERLDHMELRQADEATRKAVEAVQKRRDLERKEAYDRGVEDAMKWTQPRPSGFGQSD
ncbi:hypothetical protein D6D01_02000 [Aureobasidium pullulans]|uniref:Uncharacterized protein n=1 Tax=Aureobasidium pullulans TaxID=5580 RepID=A0A4S9LWI1_AURPU|nr:hypothetical protein D6D01_02000 [Aureobasidium pullulans]